MSLTANKMMNQMQDMLTACMIGDLSKMSSDYKLEYFENDSYYIVKIKPVNKAIQAYISKLRYIWIRKICRFTNYVFPKQPPIIRNMSSTTRDLML